MQVLKHFGTTLLLLLIPGCSLLDQRGQDWPMWRYDAGRTATSPYELPDELHLQWARQYPTLEPTWDDPLNQDLMQFDRVYEPIVHRGKLFVGSKAKDSMIALDAESGEEHWRYYVNGPVRFPAVAGDGRVYFTSDDGNLYCLNAETGDLIWKKQGAPTERKILGNERLISTWPARGGPVLKDGVVYFASGIWPFMGIFIYALDAETGAEIWRNDSNGPKYMLQPHNSPAYAGVAPQGNFVIAGDKLLIPGGRSVPACFDLNTGDFLYYHLAKNGKTGGAFVAARGNFFVNYHRDSTVSLYEVDSGNPVIRSVGKVPVLSEDTLFCRGDTISALDLGGIRQTATEQRVVFDQKEESLKTVDEKKWVLDKLWELKVDASGDLIRAGNKLYAGGEGSITAVTLAAWSGEPEISWNKQLEGTVARLIAADRKLFAVTEEGRIYAFGETSEPSPRFLTESRQEPSISEETHLRAESILRSTGAREGYGLLHGSGEDGSLAQALVQNSELRLVIVEPDPARVEELRHIFGAAGLIGKRLSVQPETAEGFIPPPYMASLVVIDDLARLEGRLDAAFFEKTFEGLRPYGGTLYIPTTEEGSAPMRRQLFEMDLPGAQISRVEHDDNLLRGVQYADKRFSERPAESELIQEIQKASELLQSEGHLLLVRSGALPGSDDWTHQYGDSANTVKSDDTLVRLPLGVLWFGGSSNMDVLPRHGHGPPEQVVGGRLFIEGMNSLSARDVYTGRVLWHREFSRLKTQGVYYDDTYKNTPLDTAYNQVHIPGANARGTNFVAAEDKVYLVLERSCLVLDPATGKTIDEFRLPTDGDGDEAPEWAYIAVYGDYLLGGAGFAAYLDFLELDELDPRMKTRLNSFYNFDITASRRLVVLNRHTGQVLWQRKAKLGFWHNAIAVADGKVFYIDRLAPSVSEALKKRSGEYRFPPPELVSLRLRDGRLMWRSTQDVFGTWLSYSADHDILVQAGRSSRDMLRGEPPGLTTHRAQDGTPLWHKEVSDGGPYILHRDSVITERTAYNLLTGDQKMRIDPLTGQQTPWVFRRDYGCNYIIGSENLLTFRSAAAGFYDLLNDGGTGTFGGFRSSCTSNLIAANGVLNAPDYTRTCSCSYQNQTSLALVHMPELELWTTYYSQPSANSIPRSRLAVLFTDLNSTPTYVNSAFSSLFNIEEGFEIAGYTIGDLWHEGEEATRILSSLKARRRWSGTTTVRAEDGSPRQVHLMARVLSDESFTPVARLFLFADPTDSAVAFADLEGNLTYVDDTFVNLWKLGDRQEVEGRFFTQIWSEEREAASIVTAWNQGREWSGELTAIRGDQSEYPIHVQTHPVADDTGRAVSAVIKCVDISEQKQLLAEAQEMIGLLGSGDHLEYFLRDGHPIQRVGINFGAPGDRKAENGTLWLEWPSNGGPSPEVELEMLPEQVSFFTHDASSFAADGPNWVVSSGVKGVSSLTLKIGNGRPVELESSGRPYDVYLYFAEPEALDRGERLFDVKLQGETALSGFDVIKEAGGPRIPVVRKIEGVMVKDKLTVDLAPHANSQIDETLLSGIEVIAH